MSVPTANAAAGLLDWLHRQNSGPELVAPDALRVRPVSRGSGKRSAIEENPDDIPDLVAEILAHFVERRLKRNLTYGYRPQEAVLGRVRGRIDQLSTERYQLMTRGLVACRFENLTVDTPRNRYVCGALGAISQIVRSPELRRRCRSLAGQS